MTDQEELVEVLRHLPDRHNATIDEYATAIIAALAHRGVTLTREPGLDVLQSAYAMALIQIEADGRTIERLKRALTVAHHRPHDNLGPPDPDSGFPTCSGCEAILTEPDAALASEDRT